MAAFDFPNSPSLDQVYAPAGGPSYKWNGYAWAKEPAAGGGGSTIAVSDTPPGGAADNSIWVESDTMGMYLRYHDSDGSQWTQLNGMADLAGYVREAPNDGKAYLRRNGIWEQQAWRTLAVFAPTASDVNNYFLTIPADVALVRISGQYKPILADTTHFLCMRYSVDGATFPAASTSYAGGIIYNQSAVGSTPAQGNPNLTYTEISLTLSTTTGINMMPVDALIACGDGNSQAAAIINASGYVVSVGQNMWHSRFLFANPGKLTHLQLFDKSFPAMMGAGTRLVFEGA